MRKVKKNAGKIICAYRLGDHSDVEERMIREGKIIRHTEERYELFSQEAKDGAGQIAKAGDYFKIDSSGKPYPNEKEWFEANHKKIGDGQYMQIPKELNAWEVTEPMCEEIEYLIAEKKMEIHPETPERYFRAMLWGSKLSAAKDAIVIFHEIRRDENHAIEEIDFSFVARSEFEKTYHDCSCETR